MLNLPVILYLGSRGVAAAGNLLAVAVFTRIAGPAEYGHYLLVFAWSMIVYGFATQWMRFAYFGVHEGLGDRQFIGSLISLAAFALTLLAAGFSIAALSGRFDPQFLGAVFALICGMTVFEAASEVARTLLNARAVALSMILRACLTVLLGSLCLWTTGEAEALALAIAVSHLVAAVPCLVAMSGLRLSYGTRASALRILRFGWPLLLSFGVTAVGQSIDRLLLAHYAGPAALGPYGVLADLLRQSFSVVGESIILAFVTVAKKQANEGDNDACTITLRTAFNACFAAAVFGAAFFFVFGEVVVRVLLGSQFVSPSQDLIPVFTIAFAFITMRNFYFAQVIYFTHASHLELVVSLLFVIVSSVLSIVLIPLHGAHGAALSLMTASIVSCVGFIVLGRLYYRLPIDASGLATITALAGVFVLGSHLAGEIGAGAAVALAIKSALFVVCSALAVYRFGLLRSAAGKETAPATKAAETVRLGSAGLNTTALR
jgi:O-antigen/teichoic acid export membrane protein